mmetsp:Transcript_9091/g.18779  ORF Transcript_9091/g.18779 Transcript_9091/m.18779 type:complete len:176 (+) Transcript_9091:130-657(+)
MATAPQPTEIRRNSRIADLDTSFYGVDCSSSFVGLDEASQEHHEYEADSIVFHPANTLDGSNDTLDRVPPATTALEEDDSPTKPDSTATAKHKSQNKKQNIRKSLSRFKSSRGPRGGVRERRLPTDSSWREADGIGRRDWKLDKLQGDLEETQARIRNLMSQLGRGSHWWGSFLK